MDALRTAVLPGIIAGVLAVIASWFWMAVVFHRYQRATPETWRSEGPRNYILAILVRVFAAIALAVLYAFVLQSRVAFFNEGFAGALRFGAAIWIAVAAPIAIEAAIFVRIHSMVVLGQVIDWLTTTILVCVTTAIWINR